MPRRSTPSRTRSSFWARPDVLAAIGIVGYLGWRLTTSKEEREREYSITAGKDYDFALLAHPYGEFASWWGEVMEALESSGAHDVSFSSRTPSDVVVNFAKAAPLTTKLRTHDVLYPNDPPLATATLIEAKASSRVTPLGQSATISGKPPRHSKPPLRTDEDRARHYEKMAADCEYDARQPHLQSEQALNLELAKDYRARARRHRKGTT